MVLYLMYVHDPNAKSEGWGYELTFSQREGEEPTCHRTPTMSQRLQASQYFTFLENQMSDLKDKPQEDYFDKVMDKFSEDGKGDNKDEKSISTSNGNDN